MMRSLYAMKEWFLDKTEAICLLFDRPVLAKYSFSDNRLRRITDNLVEPNGSRPMLNRCYVVSNCVYCFPDWYDKLVIYNMIDESVKTIDVDCDSNIYDVFQFGNYLYGIVTSKDYIIRIDTSNYLLSRFSMNGHINNNRVGCELAANLLFIPEDNYIECFDCNNNSFITIDDSCVFSGGVTCIKQYGDCFAVISDHGKMINIARITNKKWVIVNSYDIGKIIDEFEIKDIKVSGEHIVCLDWNNCNVIVYDGKLNQGYVLYISGKQSFGHILLFLYQADGHIGVITGDNRVVEIDPIAREVRTIDINCDDVNISELYEKDTLFLEGDPLTVEDLLNITSKI